MVVERKDFVGMHRAKHMNDMKLAQELVEIVEMNIRSMDFVLTVTE
jgi:hypothetical protein